MWERQPPPGTMKDWRGGYAGGKERQEMKSAGQSEVRARRCCRRPSLTFIPGMLTTDRGERESGPQALGKGCWRLWEPNWREWERKQGPWRD